MKRVYSIAKNQLEPLYIDKKYSQDKIAKIFNCSQWVISNRLRFFGIKTRPKTCNLVKRKYTFNRNFLENITPDIAWVLGLLISDGFVVKNAFSAAFGLKLKQDDRDVIFKVKKILGYDGPVLKGVTKLKHKGCIKKFPYNLLKIYDINFVEKLEQIGIKRNKTHNEKFLKCIKGTNNEEIISCFIRGIYDGDGSLLFDKKINSACFQIVGTCELLEEIQKYLIDYCHLNKTKLTRNILGTNHYALRYRGNLQVVRILDWIYKYANYFTRMDRKFNNFNEARSIIST